MNGERKASQPPGISPGDRGHRLEFNWPTGYPCIVWPVCAWSWRVSLVWVEVRKTSVFWWPISPIRKRPEVGSHFTSESAEEDWHRVTPAERQHSHFVEKGRFVRWLRGFAGVLAWPQHAAPTFLTDERDMWLLSSAPSRLKVRPSGTVSTLQVSSHVTGGSRDRRQRTSPRC